MHAKVKKTHLQSTRIQIQNNDNEQSLFFLRALESQNMKILTPKSHFEYKSPQTLQNWNPIHNLHIVPNCTWQTTKTNYLAINT
jgi:hypothetical protein